MHSSITSLLTGVYLAAVALASPVAEPVVGPVAQIDADCNGPIVNLFAFTGRSCNNTDSNSPFFYSQKFTAVDPNTNPSSPYNSGCQRIRTPTRTALSFVYTNDGADLDKCYLNVYDRNDCTGTVTNLQLIDDVSECTNQRIRSARVYCTA